MFKSLSKFRICSYFYVFESSNWEQYEIVFLKILANQKSHAGKDGPLMMIFTVFLVLITSVRCRVEYLERMSNDYSFKTQVSHSINTSMTLLNKEQFS